MALGTPGFSNVDGGGGGGGSGVPLNFSQTKGAQVTITAAEPKPATVVSTTITTTGNPVQIIVSGDANPSAGGWGRLNIYRDATAVGQVVQFESSAANENVPYSLEVVDEPAAGTWTYSLKVTTVTTDTQFGESAGPIITVVELGGVGTAVPSGAAGGDLGGTYPNPDVVAIQGYSVSTTAPGSGEALVWDGSSWVPTAVSAGAGGNDTNIQYNSGGSLAGTNNFVFDAGSNRVTLTDGAQALDVYPNLVEYVGGGSLQIESSTSVDIATLTATGINLGSATAATTIAGAFTLPTTDGASGEVLTTDGSGTVTWQASGGGGGAAGAANEIQYNDGSNALTASSGLTFDGTTLAINSIGPAALTISSTIDGQFMDVNTSLYSLTLSDPTQLPTLVNATMGPSDLAIYDGNVSQSGNVQAGLVGVFDNATTNNLKMIIPAGVATIKSEDALFASQALNLSIGELQVNGSAGSAGEVITSNGSGSAPTWQAIPIAATDITDNYFVDAVLGNDLTADGSISKPYATIQACLTAIGHPTSKQDAARKITVNIAPAHSSAGGIIASQANNFDSIYQENLWVPSRMITFVGPGVKIGNSGDASGFGNITQEISTARRFGASSSEMRHTLSFIGRANSRDTHSRIRNGIHIGGITRISCVARNIGTIQGDSVGGTRVTITLAGGQNPYGIAVSPYASLNVTLTDAGDTIGYTSPTGVAIANSTVAGQQIFFKSISGTTGPAIDTYYYVVNATATTFQISNSIGGAPIALTGNGTGVIMSKPAYAPFEDLVRIKVAGTTNYGTTGTTVAYDIIEKLTDTSFIARRVTGTNTSAAVESTGTIAETDSTGSSTSLTHDMFFDRCYQQGLVVHDDGVVYSAAPAVGSGGALYARDSRFNAGFLATGATVQRWENSQAVTTVNAGATITSFSRTTNVITVITSATCQWATGQVVTIATSTSGAQNIDGTWVIATGGTNTFTLSQTGADYGAQVPSGTGTITATSMWSTIVTMAQSTFTGAGIQLAGTPFTLSTDDAGVANTRFGVTRLYTTTTTAMPLARIDAYTSHWLYAGGAYLSFPVTFTDAGDTVTRTNHGLSNGALVRFSGIVNTTGISTNTDYYVVGAATSTFQLALTPGGSAIALTTNGTGTLDVLPTYYPAFLDTYVPTQLFTGNQWVQTSTVTVANTTTETNLTGGGIGMVNFPANFLKIGRNLRISGAGYFSCTASTPTLRLQIKLGAVVIADTTAITMPVADTNKAFTFDVNASVRSTGASGTVFANGTMTRMATTLAVIPMNVLSAGVPTTATVNTTTAQLLTVTATWSAADPANTITLTNLVITG